MLKKLLSTALASVIVATTVLSFSTDAEARKRGHGRRGGHHHNNCQRWKMVPYHGHLVGRWICGAGKF